MKQLLETGLELFFYYYVDLMNYFLVIISLLKTSNVNFYLIH